MKSYYECLDRNKCQISDPVFGGCNYDKCVATADTSSIPWGFIPSPLRYSKTPACGDPKLIAGDYPAAAGVMHVPTILSILALFVGRFFA
jgi:hypothetical protein